MKKLIITFLITLLIISIIAISIISYKFNNYKAKDYQISIEENALKYFHENYEECRSNFISISIKNILIAKSMA